MQKFHSKLHINWFKTGILTFKHKTNINGQPIKYIVAKLQVREIDRYLIHPDFDLSNGNSWNDVCLLTLKTELEYNENVKCIKLNDKFIEPWETKCIVSGWGRLQVLSYNLILYKV